MQKKLYKSKNDRKISGVCGGIGEYLGVDSTIVRLVVLLACLFTGVGLLAYLAAILIIPEDPGYIEGTATEKKE